MSTQSPTPSPMPQTINLDHLMQSLSHPLRRTAAMLGLGLNASGDGCRDGRLTTQSAVAMMPAVTDPAHIARQTELFRNWLIAQGLTEALMHWNTWLTTVHRIATGMAKAKQVRTAVEIEAFRQSFQQTPWPQRAALLHAHCQIPLPTMVNLQELHDVLLVLTRRDGIVPADRQTPLTLHWQAPERTLHDTDKAPGLTWTEKSRIMAPGTPVALTPLELHELFLSVEHSGHQIIRGLAAYLQDLGVSRQSAQTPASPDQGPAQPQV